MYHDHDDQIIGYRMAEMDLSLASSSSSVTVAIAKKSFLKLKLIKSYLGSIMSQDPLNNLSLISIEHETVKKIDFDQVISNFDSAKARKVMITFIPLIFEFVVFQLLINTIGGILFIWYIFFPPKRERHNEYRPQAALSLGTPLTTIVCVCLI